MAPPGLVSVESAHETAETLDRLVAAIAAHGMTVMARIDHAGAAAKVGLSLRPTEVVLFGNPRGGTGLMQVAQTIGIDLPLKALVWMDEGGKTWVSYNAPQWLASRHEIGSAGDKAVSAMTDALAAVAKAATAP
jgi:uncharacterized protein (DUF302 family)